MPSVGIEPATLRPLWLLVTLIDRQFICSLFSAHSAVTLWCVRHASMDACANKTPTDNHGYNFYKIKIEQKRFFSAELLQQVVILRNALTRFVSPDAKFMEIIKNYSEVLCSNNFNFFTDKRANDIDNAVKQQINHLWYRSIFPAKQAKAITQNLQLRQLIRARLKSAGEWECQLWR